MYKRLAGRYNTRGQLSYEYHQTIATPPPCTLTASIILRTATTITLHSTNKLTLPIPDKLTTFLSRLTQGPSHLWKGRDIDVTGDWILCAIQSGMLMIAHDGSYRPQLDKSICSMGIVLIRMHTGHMGKISACERTDAFTASNYRGKRLGALLSSHIICIASKFSGSTKPIHLYCDNMGVIHHALHPDTKLKANQAQSDILAAFKHNLTNATLPWEYHHH